MNVISFSPLDQQLLRFSPLNHVTEITCHLFKTEQFDFEEGTFESGLWIKLLLSLAMATLEPTCAFEINKPKPLNVLQKVMSFAVILSVVLPMILLKND